jgi:hypothetical protein
MVISVIPLAIFASPSSNSLNLFPPPPESNPYGVSYNEHVKNFWKWILAIPKTDNPFIGDDTTGEKCAIGQSNSSSKVFYLAPNEGGENKRTCKVPADKGLLIPVMHVEWSIFESPESLPMDLVRLAKNDQDRTALDKLYLKIDDKEYFGNVLEKYRTRTEPFQTTWPNNPIFGNVGGGNTTTVGDGWYILTEPPAKGNHTIAFSSLLKPKADGTGAYATNITYTIVAE